MEKNNPSSRGVQTFRPQRELESSENLQFSEAEMKMERFLDKSRIILYRNEKDLI